jgi:hypothetical protein
MDLRSRSERTRGVSGASNNPIFDEGHQLPKKAAKTTEENKPWKSKWHQEEEEEKKVRWSRHATVEEDSMVASEE